MIGGWFAAGGGGGDGGLLLPPPPQAATAHAPARAAACQRGARSRVDVPVFMKPVIAPGDRPASVSLERCAHVPFWPCPALLERTAFSQVIGVMRRPALAKGGIRVQKAGLEKEDRINGRR